MQEIIKNEGGVRIPPNEITSSHLEMLKSVLETGGAIEEWAAFLMDARCGVIDTRLKRDGFDTAEVPWDIRTAVINVCHSVGYANFNPVRAVWFFERLDDGRYENALVGLKNRYPEWWAEKPTRAEWITEAFKNAEDKAEKGLKDAAGPLYEG